MAKQLNVSQVDIEFLLLNTSGGEYNLLPHLEEFNIYEDIFSNQLTGYISLIDGYNIPYKLPIVGEERLITNISLRGVDGGLTIAPPDLHVNSLSDRFLRNPQSQRFGLELVSTKYMNNICSKVSQSYKDQTISEIAESIDYEYLEDGSDMYVEDTDRVEHIVIPNWTPYKALNWLAERAVSKKTGAANYLYYETMQEVYFKSLSMLCSEEPILTFVYAPRIDDPTKIEGLSGSIVKIEKLDFMNSFKKAKNLTRGQYASKLITHDIVSKKIQQHDYSHLTDWENHEHCGDFPPVSDIDYVMDVDTDRTSYAPPVDDSDPIVSGARLSQLTDSLVLFHPKHNKMYSKNEDHAYDNKVEEWKLQHRAQKAIFDNSTIQVECAGLSFIRVGMTVTLYIDSPEKSTPESSVDEMLSGKFLITAVKHVFSKTGTGNEIAYKMVLELSKDGLEEKIYSRRFGPKSKSVGV